MCHEAKSVRVTESRPRLLRRYDGTAVAFLAVSRQPRPFEGGHEMARCAVCGADYDKTMDIRLNGVTSSYDCFECAIHALAPACEHCGCRIIGHGVETGGRMFCCAHCAQRSAHRVTA